MTIVVSDLHLGEGKSDDNGPSGLLLELFRHDDEFAAMINFYLSMAAELKLQLRLVMLGDFLDFPRVVPLKAEPKSSGGAIAKVSRIVAGHPVLFNALRRLTDADHTIDILPGNHDPQLMNVALQSELIRAMDGSSPDQVRFHNWVLYVPGVFYAEHGNQYHDINSFPNWLRFAHPEGPTPDLPIGPIFDDYIAKVARLTGQSSLNLKANLARIIRSPALALKTLPANAVFMAQIIFNVSGLAAGRGTSPRDAYRMSRLAEESTQVGLPVDALAAIDRLAEGIARELPGRMAQAARRVAVRRLSFCRHVAANASIGVLSSPAQRSARIRQIAAQIDDVLTDTGHQVPFYIFGHTHRAADEPIRANGDGARYLNTGSWTGEHAPAVSAIPVLSYVLLQTGVANERPRATLMAWNTDQDRPEPIGQS